MERSIDIDCQYLFITKNTPHYHKYHESITYSIQLQIFWVSSCRPSLLTSKHPGPHSWLACFTLAEILPSEFSCWMTFDFSFIRKIHTGSEKQEVTGTLRWFHLKGLEYSTSQGPSVGEPEWALKANPERFRVIY